MKNEKSIRIKGIPVETVIIPKNDALNLAPVNFAPCFKNHFIFEMEGFDSYTVVSVKLPEIIWQGNKLTAQGKLEVTLYDPVEENELDKALKALKAGKKPAKIKILDPIGQIKKTLSLDLTPTHVHADEYTYDKVEPMKILVKFDVDNLVLTS